MSLTAASETGAARAVHAEPHGRKRGRRRAERSDREPRRKRDRRRAKRSPAERAASEGGARRAVRRHPRRHERKRRRAEPADAEPRRRKRDRGRAERPDGEPHRRRCGPNRKRSKPGQSTSAAAAASASDAGTTLGRRGVCSAGPTAGRAAAEPSASRPTVAGVHLHRSGAPASSTAVQVEGVVRRERAGAHPPPPAGRRAAPPRRLAHTCSLRPFPTTHRGGPQLSRTAGAAGGHERWRDRAGPKVGLLQRGPLPPAPGDSRPSSRTRSRASSSDPPPASTPPPTDHFRSSTRPPAKGRARDGVDPDTLSGKFLDRFKRDLLIEREQLGHLIIQQPIREHDRTCPQKTSSPSRLLLKFEFQGLDVKLGFLRLGDGLLVSELRRAREREGERPEHVRAPSALAA